MRILLPALILTACTAVELPPLPEDHPASPTAAPAPRASPSGLLDVSAPVPAAAPDLPEEPEHQHPHEQHGDAGRVDPRTETEEAGEEPPEGPMPGAGR